MDFFVRCPTSLCNQPFQFEKQINKYRKHYRGKNGKGFLIPAHVAQKIAASVWGGYQKLLYGSGQQVRFSKWSEFSTITAKTNSAGIRYADGFVFFQGMQLHVLFDEKDPYGYQQEATSRAIRYCGIHRRWYAGGWKYFVQLTLDGLPPLKTRPDTGELLHPMGEGRVGHDIGTQTIASVGCNAVLLTELADKVRGIDAELWKLNRAMDRSRRATNPEMFNTDGSIVPKDKLPAASITSKRCGSVLWQNRRRRQNSTARGGPSERNGSENPSSIKRLRCLLKPSSERYLMQEVRSKESIPSP